MPSRRARTSHRLRGARRRLPRPPSAERAARTAPTSRRALLRPRTHDRARPTAAAFLKGLRLRAAASRASDARLPAPHRPRPRPRAVGQLARSSVARRSASIACADVCRAASARAAVVARPPLPSSECATPRVRPRFASRAARPPASRFAARRRPAGRRLFRRSQLWQSVFAATEPASACVWRARVGAACLRRIGSRRAMRIVDAAVADPVAARSRRSSSATARRGARIKARARGRQDAVGPSATATRSSRARPAGPRAGRSRDRARARRSPRRSTARAPDFRAPPPRDSAALRGRPVARRARCRRVAARAAIAARRRARRPRSAGSSGARRQFACFSRASGARSLGRRRPSARAAAAPPAARGWRARVRRFCVHGRTARAAAASATCRRSSARDCVAGVVVGGRCGALYAVRSRAAVSRADPRPPRLARLGGGSRQRQRASRHAERRSATLRARTHRARRRPPRRCGWLGCARGGGARLATIVAAVDVPAGAPPPAPALRAAKLAGAPPQASLATRRAPRDRGGARTVGRGAAAARAPEEDVGDGGTTAAIRRRARRSGMSMTRRRSRRSCVAEHAAAQLARAASRPRASRAAPRALARA